MNNASLVVVGSGIKCVSHLTTEAKAYIKKSDVVLYLVNDPAIKEWIQNTNYNSESLDKLYTKYPLRIQCYQAITDYILATLRKDMHVCVVLYGHPIIFSQPALEAVLKAQDEGYYAKFLPGISAEDCLFADLLIDPGRYGCQSFEATDFLLYRRKYDPCCVLILWQIGFIGLLGHDENYDNSTGIKLLLEYLSPSYSLEHQVIVYEAAVYPGFDPRIDKVILKTLPQVGLSKISTLCIPPATQGILDEKILEKLKIRQQIYKS